MTKTVKVGNYVVQGDNCDFYTYLSGLEGIAQISVNSMNDGNGSRKFEIKIQYYNPTTRTFKINTRGRKSKTSWLIRIGEDINGKSIESKILSYTS